MKNLLYVICILCTILSCAPSNSDTNSEDTTEVSETPQTDESSEEANTSSSSSPDPDQDPCDLLDIEVLASTLGLQADLITLEKDKNRGMYCTARTSEFNIEGHKTIQVVYLDKMASKDGKPDFDKMMNKQISNKVYRDATIHNVDGIGDLAFYYSEQSSSTLLLHFNNQVRYVLTLRREVPEKAKVYGLKLSSEELEEKLLELAKKIF